MHITEKKDSKVIELRGVSFSYPSEGGSRLQILKDFSLSLPASRVSVVLGPSGCGKTTVLNLIAGLCLPESGELVVGGVSSLDADSTMPGMSLLFQEPRLLPWRNIRKNIELVLEKKVPKAEAREKAEHYLELVGLADFSRYYPAELSGGMRQRVSIARAFAYPADIILMDEPFQALDLGLKMSLTELFTKLWVEDSRTAVFVTHDINEAIMLGDEIFVLAGSRPTQIVEDMRNPVPHKLRAPASPESVEIERRLYELLK